MHLHCCTESLNIDARGTSNTNSKVQFKNTMIKSSLCDYSDTYIPVKETITVVGQGAAPTSAATDRNNKQVKFKNCSPFTDYIDEINSTQVDNVKDLDIEISMYNLIGYSKNYSTASQSLCKYCGD